jgi:hypothetical protein
MKYLLASLLLLICYARSASGDWLELAAAYRLEASCAQTDHVKSLDLSRVCLPMPLTNGVVVYGEDGEKLPFSLDVETNGLMIGAGPQSGRVTVYWGYEQAQARAFQADNLGTLPSGGRLKMTVVHCNLKNFSDSDWLQEKKTRLERKYDRTITRNAERIPAVKLAWLKTEERERPRLDKLSEDEQNWRDRVSQAEAALKAVRTQLAKAQKNLALERKKPAKERDEKACQTEIAKVKKTLARATEKLKKDKSTLAARAKRSRQVKGKIDQARRRYENAHKAWQKSLDEKKQAIDELAAKADQGQERELEVLDYFPPNKRARLLGTSFPEKAEVPRMPFGSRSAFAAEFSGTLPIEQDAEVEFAVDATSSVLLFVDDKLLINWYGDHKPNYDWLQNCRVKLSAGLHEFKYYYKRGEVKVETYARVAWKRPGDADFAVLGATDFAAGFPVKATSFSDRQGNRYPLVEAGQPLSIFTGKTRRLDWIKAQTLDGAGIAWRLDGKTVADGPQANLFFEVDSLPGVLPPLGKTLTLKPADSSALDVALPTCDNTRKNYAPADLSMNLRPPQFIYDDETLDMSLEVISALPQDIACHLKVECADSDNPFASLAGELILPGKPDSPALKFEPPSLVSRSLALEGARLAAGRRVTFTLESGGVTFSRESLRFVPVEALPELNFNGDHLVGADSARIVPVLHRYSLQELRGWQLPDILTAAWFKPHRALLIASDFTDGNTSFFQALTQGLQQQDVALDCLALGARTPVLASLAEVIAPIRKATAEVAILIPPLDPSSTDRQRTRALAAVIQVLKANPAIRKIMLATPYPSPTGSPDSVLVPMLRSLARENGVEVLELRGFLLKHHRWQEFYRRPEDSSGQLSHFPVAQIPLLAQWLAQNLH